MCKKLIIGIFTIVLTVIFGKGVIPKYQNMNNNSIAEEQEKFIKNEEIAVEEMIAKVEEIVTEVKGDVIVEKKTEEEQEIEATNEEVVKPKEQKKEVIESPKEKQKSKVVTTKKEEQVVTPAENKVQEEKKEPPCKTTENKEEPKTQQEEKIQTEEKQEDTSAKAEQIPEGKTEEKPVQDTKEKITYNKDATQQLIDDIDKLAKQNPSLWDKNGNKLYKIEKAESLVGKNYMYPYRKQHVAGVVLNVFPIKFLVYAIDVEKDGFTKETRYYIDVASLN